MKFFLHYLALLNIIDGIATYIGVSSKLIEEANPLMKTILDTDPYLFLFVKFALSFTLIFILLLNKIPEYSIVKIAAGLGSFVYTIIICFHSVWITQALI
ncbi:DUF5658 family protein [Bacillus weihaiensis]|uniref:DUF5658 domain-containing protein n=1 Tax=Bacillus weihaiensis TaxID=1547283 RepID=A0A1L3MPY3_9BACI|nr:DUF5658 family protein [Bacillus weihaiensis]APH04410.1 hypothetical protein A9C19_06420 [Bacillus weihaiensis]